MSIQAKLNDLTNRRQSIEFMSGDDLLKKTHSDGKLFVRERILELLDEQSFVEIGMFVKPRSTDFHLAEKDLPADGVICGYGTIKGRLVYIYGQDSTVLGGAIGEMHAKKIIRLYEMAIKTGSPIIGLLDTAGLRLEEGIDALDGFGKIYQQQVKASGAIPQITAILGECGGGSSVLSSLSDFTFMTTNKTHLFVNSPNTYLNDDDSDIASATFHAEKTGLVDQIFQTERELYMAIRELVEYLPANHKEMAPVHKMQDDLNRVSNELDTVEAQNDIDGIKLIQTLCDEGLCFEVKANYGDQIVLALARMQGRTVGFLASHTSQDNGGRMGIAELKKMVRFIRFCDAFGLPIVTLIDCQGFKAQAAQETDGLGDWMGKIAYAFIKASVPKINIITKHAYGSAYVLLNSSHIGADLVYAWPTAEIGVMKAENAIRILKAQSIDDADHPGEWIKSASKDYKETIESPYMAASRGYIDSVIEPSTTRKHLLLALEVLYSKNEALDHVKHSSL